MPSYSHPKDVLEAMIASRSDAALVVVSDISGGTLRAKSTLMAVTQDSSYGYISAGCVDGDIIFQARAALADGKPRALVYGEGSPFKDIALPCGGTIEIKIFPHPDRAAIRQAAAQLATRQTAQLKLDDHLFEYIPKLRLRLIGRSAPFSSLAKLALASGFDVLGQSPDQELSQEGFIRFDHLTSPDGLPAINDDIWTAVVFLFHDHDWEPALLKQALQGKSFYIGAMGSAQTHAARINALKSVGIENTGRIRGPIGLIPAMRDAQMLAVSILAEIIDEARRQGRLS